ncbi:MAG: MmcQ/YjbR family DNA-binding protein [Pseudomonadales bacterium]|nr:MmcQ/YjbR family DNA-binding protein [Pseudomonadales bacterium]
MNYKQCRAYLRKRPDAYEDFPFGVNIAVFKVNKKMFATLAYQDKIANMNLKCDPDEAMALRDIFEAVIPGYHMNKTHWNTIILNDSIPRGEIERMIDRSYGLVVKSLKKVDRMALEIKYGSENLYR